MTPASAASTGSSPAIRAGQAACEAWSDWTQALCGLPAAALYRRACVHEHLRDGWLCKDHAAHADQGYCMTCYETDGHECPIVLVEVTR